jgi:diamine N-acetyltransferase
MELRIRNLHANDFAGLRELVQQVHNLHLSKRPDIFGDVDPLSLEYFEYILKDESTITLVAELDGQIVGYCILIIKKPSSNPLMKPRKVLFMDNLCVHENYRNQGIGKKLYLEALTRARQLGADSLELSVWSFNENAIEFYKAMGMTEKIITMETKI